MHTCRPRRPELCSDAGQVFLDRYGELIDLSASGQLAMRQVLQAHLKRVTRDKQRFPARLHQFFDRSATIEREVDEDIRQRERARRHGVYFLRVPGTRVE